VSRHENAVSRADPKLVMCQGSKAAEQAGVRQAGAGFNTVVSPALHLEDVSDSASERLSVGVSDAAGCWSLPWWVPKSRLAATSSISSSLGLGLCRPPELVSFLPVGRPCLPARTASPPAPAAAVGKRKRVGSKKHSRGVVGGMHRHNRSSNGLAEIWRPVMPSQLPVLQARPLCHCTAQGNQHPQPPTFGC
jgi:hypothetical protein